MADMTAEATQGYLAAPDARCPYLATSDSFNAWHVGRYMKAEDLGRPALGDGMADKTRLALSSGRGNIVTLRGYKATLLATFRVDDNGTVRPSR